MPGDFEPDIVSPRPGLEASLSIADRAIVLALRPVVLQEKRVDDVQAFRLVMLGPQRFCLAEHFEQSLELSTAPQWGPEAQSRVDGRPHGFPRRRDARQRVHGSLIVGRGLCVDTERRRAIGGLTAILCCLLPDLAPRRVMGEPLNLLAEAIPVERLERLDDPRV